MTTLLLSLLASDQLVAERSFDLLINFHIYLCTVIGHFVHYVPQGILEGMCSIPHMKSKKSHYLGVSCQKEDIIPGGRCPTCSLTKDFHNNKILKILWKYLAEVFWFQNEMFCRSQM
jgi:hypothetical protein